MKNISFQIGYENKIQEDPQNEYCVYKLMYFLRFKQLPVGHKGPFFMQKATQPELKSRLQEGNLRSESDTKFFSNCTFEKYVKSLAVKCGFTDAAW